MSDKKDKAFSRVELKNDFKRKMNKEIRNIQADFKLSDNESIANIIKKVSGVNESFSRNIKP